MREYCERKEASPPEKTINHNDDMDLKKIKDTVPITTQTRNLQEIVQPTGNIYESVAIIGKRANQISAQLKEELSQKLQEFGSSTDNLEETFENEELILISRQYEQLPKSTLIATQEFVDGKLYFRNAEE